MDMDTAQGEFPGLQIVTAGLGEDQVQILFDRVGDPLTVIALEASSGLHVPVAFRLRSVLDCSVGRRARFVIEDLASAKGEGPTAELQTSDPVSAIQAWSAVTPCLDP